jgi:predicted Zn finger-like uncharacterized protein
MSLITRCPACTTLFKVVPDQLRVSEGWVRCGQCDEVFDANAHLQGDALAPPQVPSGVPQGSPNEESSGVDTEPQMPPDPEPQLQEELAATLQWPAAPVTPYDDVMDVRPGAVFESGPALHLELPEDPVIEPDSFEPFSGEAEVSHATQSEATSDGPAAAEPFEPAGQAVDFADLSHAPDSEEAVPPAFMRTARTSSVWQRPWVRGALVVMALFFAAALLAQVVWRERDRLAVSVPDLRPSLMAMCSALGCQISPFKQIESVVIDSSSFVKIRGDVYRLNITLKNLSPIDVASPAVELTLTDLQDQPLVRHVLSASDLGAAQGTLVASGELAAVISVHVKVAGSTERISGYRLLAFYP